MEERIYRQLMELVRIPSVTGSEDEIEIARFIYESLAKENYFKEHPSHLALVPGPDGKRISVVAMVRSTADVSDTVLFIGHFDVVGAEVYGELANKAFDPEALGRSLRCRPMDQQAKEDLESGNWIFGRGVMDMKCGVAIELDLLKEFARDPSLFDVNAAVALVFDEEGSSQGMLSVLPFLVQLAEREELRYIGAVNTEPTDAGLPGAPGPGYFLSTMGKALVMVYVVGEEAHGGSYYRGLSAALVQDFINLELEAHPELRDSSANSVTIPPFVLYCECRRKESYSITIPHMSMAYYNVFTVSRSPSDVLKMFKEAASKGAKKALEYLGASYKAMKNFGYTGAVKRYDEVCILSYEELRRQASRNYPGDFEIAEREMISNLKSPDKDLREQGINLAEWMIPWRDQQGPVVIVGFLPPFMPHRSSYGRTETEVHFRRAVESTVSYAETTFGRHLQECPAFGGLCDLSYIGCQVNEGERQILENNIPGWGMLYSLPFESMGRLNMPIINLGPLGRGAHTWAERLERDYALRELPQLLRHFVRSLAVQAGGD
ncbi:M20/M25/M40 family metallo-hydrolase [Acetomicrobium sp.]|uniref:M20/M25/M40 family metallo-hydrolase n=1 Tax=Acetomicrobium sp. TaxID=1872099 RepID=UPI002FC6046E